MILETAADFRRVERIRATIDDIAQQVDARLDAIGRPSGFARLEWAASTAGGPAGAQLDRARHACAEFAAYSKRLGTVDEPTLKARRVRRLARNVFAEIVPGGFLAETLALNLLLMEWDNEMECRAVARALGAENA